MVLKPKRPIMGVQSGGPRLLMRQPSVTAVSDSKENDNEKHDLQLVGQRWSLDDARHRVYRRSGAAVRRHRRWSRDTLEGVIILSVCFGVVFGGCAAGALIGWLFF
jgi:hypothetical protein